MSKRVGERVKVRNVFVKGGNKRNEMFIRNGPLKEKSGFLVALCGFCGFVLRLQCCCGLRQKKKKGN